MASISPADEQQGVLAAGLASVRTALRAVFSEETRLDLVSRYQRHGPAAAEYFTRYAACAEPEGLRAEVGLVAGEPVIALMGTSRPTYFIRLAWKGDSVSLARDYRHVAYIADEAAFAPLK